MERLGCLSKSLLKYKSNNNYISYMQSSAFFLIELFHQTLLKPTDLTRIKECYFTQESNNEIILKINIQ